MDSRSDEITINDCLREALDQLLRAVKDYIPAAQLHPVDLGHPAANRLALAQLRAYDVLYPGTTRHG